jgi:hypothetical protein
MGDKGAEGERQETGIRMVGGTQRVKFEGATSGTTGTEGSGKGMNGGISS